MVEILSILSENIFFLFSFCVGAGMILSMIFYWSDSGSWKKFGIRVIRHDPDPQQYKPGSGFYLCIHNHLLSFMIPNLSLGSLWTTTTMPAILLTWQKPWLRSIRRTLHLGKKILFTIIITLFFISVAAPDPGSGFQCLFDPRIRVGKMSDPG